MELIGVTNWNTTFGAQLTALPLVKLVFGYAKTGNNNKKYFEFF